MSRNKKPLSLIKNQGTYRKDRHADRPDEPLEIKYPACPEWLDGIAKAEWDRIEKILTPLEVITEADQMGLAACCSLYSRIQQNADSASLFAQLRMFLGEYGLTPSSRIRIAPKEKKADHTNPWGKFS